MSRSSRRFPGEWGKGGRIRGHALTDFLGSNSGEEFLMNKILHLIAQVTNLISRASKWANFWCVNFCLSPPTLPDALSFFPSIKWLLVVHSFSWYSKPGSRSVREMAFWGQPSILSQTKIFTFPTNKNEYTAPSIRQPATNGCLAEQILRKELLKLPFSLLTYIHSFFKFCIFWLPVMKDITHIDFLKFHSWFSLRPACCIHLLTVQSWWDHILDLEKSLAPWLTVLLLGIYFPPSPRWAYIPQNRNVTTALFTVGHKAETTQMSTDRSLDKQNVVHLFYLAIKENELLTHATTRNESQNSIILGKRSQTQKST